MKRQPIQNDGATKITFRLFPPYTQRVAEQAEAAKLKVNQYARIATMALADGGLLNLSERMQRIEDELIHLRLDFEQAVVDTTDLDD